MAPTWHPHGHQHKRGRMWSHLMHVLHGVESREDILKDSWYKSPELRLLTRGVGPWFESRTQHRVPALFLPWQPVHAFLFTIAVCLHVES